MSCTTFKKSSIAVSPVTCSNPYYFEFRKFAIKSALRPTSTCVKTINETNHPKPGFIGAPVIFKAGNLHTKIVVPREHAHGLRRDSGCGATSTFGDSDPEKEKVLRLKLGMKVAGVF